MTDIIPPEDSKIPNDIYDAGKSIVFSKNVFAYNIIYIEDSSNVEVKEECKHDDLLDSLIGMNEGVYNLDEDDIADAIDDEEEQIDTSKHEPKVEVKEEISYKFEAKEEMITETYEELEEKYKKLKEEAGSGRFNDQLIKKQLEYLKTMRRKKIEDRWIKALVYFGIEPEHYRDPSSRHKILKMYPFSEFSFARAKKGEFNKQKMGKLIVELCKFEVVNDTYNVECKVSLIL